MASISQNPLPNSLPDWRNFGIVLRVLIGANLALALAALVQAGGLPGWLSRYYVLAAWCEPPLLGAIGLLALLRDQLWRLPIRYGRLTVMAIAAFCAFLQYHLWLWLGLVDSERWGNWQAGLLGTALAALLLHYLELRARAHSPAIAEARLMALNARIRPHFLFNAINAVLSLIRAQPKQAESALETISDLFRAALRDPADWLPLSEEISLCRQYLELEKLRLGERLQVEWDIRSVPLDTLIPPLMLQPLVENAVFHGIEPAPDGGTIRIIFMRKDNDLVIEVANQHCNTPRQSAGNQIALTNIRERLALYYDLEARLEIDQSDTHYRIRIVLPCQTRNNHYPY
ncbi:MAG: Histidine kinase internal region [Proteobacteria bacterium]|nr:Histidine kinase internal region [Pseudomonadota bacterium]